MLGYPNFGNPGDHLLWLGQSAALAELGARIEHVATPESYDAARLRARCPAGTIFLSGGGNFGDLWPRMQGLRERVIRDFPQRRIVQLPQSVSFADGSRAHAFGVAARAHGDVHIFIRDTDSRDRLRDQSMLESTLCPDGAYGLRLSPRRVSGSSTVWLLRQDKERGDIERIPESVDWIEHLSFRRCMAAAVPYVGRFSPALAAFTSGRFERASAALLSHARIIVTDRLHAGILSSLLGIPHVVLDNSYGKVHAFYRTWFDGAPGVRLAKTVAEARAMAAELETFSQ